MILSFRRVSLTVHPDKWTDDDGKRKSQEVFKYLSAMRDQINAGEWSLNRSLDTIPIWLSANISGTPDRYPYLIKGKFIN